MRRWLVVVGGCFAAIAYGCLWDRDTLAQEARKFPGLSQMITGRFERNPALYYEMRLARVQGEIKERPQDLDLYDDAGVACDRLGRSDEAIGWMRRKAGRMDKGAGSEDRYRYHANLGTFLAHKWFREQPSKSVDLLRQGRDHIAKSIEINPDAHFGRERVQLAVMDWVLQNRGADAVANAGRSNGGSGRQTLGDYLNDLAKVGSDRKTEVRAMVRGLAGLVVLGNAWESPDVFEALASLLSRWREGSIALMAASRANELLRSGKKSIVNLSTVELDYWEPSDRRGVIYHFGGLRAEAEDWALRRETYMMERLKQGKHPDTARDFWRDWYDQGPPDLPDPIDWVPILWRGSLGLVGALSLLVAWRVRSRRKRAR